MSKQHLSRDDRIFMSGKRRGAQETMDMVAMVLQDKFGFHVRDGGRDTMSIEYLYHCIEDLAAAINSGYIKRQDIKHTLAEEYGVEFGD